MNRCKILIAAAFVAAFAFPALANSAAPTAPSDAVSGQNDTLYIWCFPAEAVVAALVRRGEVPVFTGLDAGEGSDRFVLTLAPDGTWSLLLAINERPDLLCAVSAGESGRVMEGETP